MRYPTSVTHIKNSVAKEATAKASSPVAVTSDNGEAD